MTHNADEQSPFFSIVTCTYNRVQTLRRALDSLRGQSCQDWECIIIDDASLDGTGEVVRPYLGEHFRYLRHSHRGCARSKNAGLEAASGRYVTFLDSDDEYDPGHLAIRKEILLRDPAVDLLYSDVRVVGEEYVPDKDDPAKRIAIADCVVGGSFVIKRSALGPTDRFHDVNSDDSDFLEHFAASGKKILRINQPTYVYHRDSPDSMCDAL
jgi:glycosyltransferase involved in cell wall biosynthesis